MPEVENLTHLVRTATLTGNYYSDSGCDKQSYPFLLFHL